MAAIFNGFWWISQRSKPPVNKIQVLIMTVCDILYQTDRFCRVKTHFFGRHPTEKPRAGETVTTLSVPTSLSCLQRSAPRPSSSKTALISLRAAVSANIIQRRGSRVILCPDCLQQLINTPYISLSSSEMLVLQGFFFNPTLVNKMHWYLLNTILLKVKCVMLDKLQGKSGLWRTTCCSWSW